MLAGRFNANNPEGTIVKLKNDKDFINYQAGLTFKPVENGSIYASYATSTNPWGGDGGDGSEPITSAIQNLNPEEDRTMELGSKWDVLNDKLNLTAAMFRTQKTSTRAPVEHGTTRNIGDT